MTQIFKTKLFSWSGWLIWTAEIVANAAKKSFLSDFYKLFADDYFLLFLLIFFVFAFFECFWNTFRKSHTRNFHEYVPAHTSKWVYRKKWRINLKTNAHIFVISYITPWAVLNFFGIRKFIKWGNKSLYFSFKELLN